MKNRIDKILHIVAVLLLVLIITAVNKTTAYAEDGVTIKLHYTRDDNAYDDWSVWFWEYGKDGADYAFLEENGEMVASFKPEAGTTSVGFIVRTQSWDKDVSDDRFIDISEMISGTVDIYVKTGVSEFEKRYGEDAVKGTKLKLAKSEGGNILKVTMTGEISGDIPSSFRVTSRNGDIDIQGAEYDGDYVYTLYLSKELEPAKSYSIIFEKQGYKITMPNFYSDKEFEEKYTYTGNDLGAVWSKEKTVFKVWAPTAEAMTVRLYESGNSKKSDRTKEIPMTLTDNGVWEAIEDGDLNGVYYTYAVTIDGITKEACDPYARTTGVNGKRAMVIDLDSTDPKGWDKDSNPHAGEGINDAIIYEAHIRDLTTEEGAGITNVGKYPGVAELGTATSSGIATGLSHMIGLGITHLHILPFYDYASVDEESENGYNWGYDPENYNVPEGSYSTDPYDGEVRVKEVKEMVMALHNNGISVVMDVVYNHVNSAKDFNFNIIVPGYFSRITETGTYSNGSGCGNDTASERSMVRKYIVDSVCYWADEYHIDGFRFDLVGLLDTYTINEIVTEVHKTHPDVIFYGEGWNLTTVVTKEDVTLATMQNSELTSGFAYFNDTIRDGLKGSVFNKEPGYVSGSKGDTPKIARCFLGLDNWCKSPAQTINYASCHDNNTLFDRLTLSRPEAAYEEIVNMNKLTAAIYMTSQGVPFMQAGEEMLRSKVNADGSFNENSYNAGDEVNTIRYSSLSDENVEAVYEYYKGLIAFRKAHKALRMSEAADVNKYISQVRTDEDRVLAFEIDGSYEGEISDRIMMVFNPTEEPVTINLSEGKWDVCINKDKAGIVSLGKAEGTVSVDAVSALVLTQGKISDVSNGTALKVSLFAGIAAVFAGIVAVIVKKRKE